MLRTKLHAVVVTLIAAAGFATATVAPAVSQAKDSSSSSPDASKCQENREMGAHSIEEAVEAVGRGDYFGASIWASYASDDAKEAGKNCGTSAAALSTTKVRVGRGVTIRVPRVSLIASRGVAGVAVVHAASPAARVTTRPGVAVQQISTVVGLEASSADKHPSKADESECKHEAQRYDEHIGAAHKAAASGNIADFTEYFQFAVGDLYGLKVTNCKVVAG